MVLTRNVEALGTLDFAVHSTPADNHECGELLEDFKARLPSPSDPPSSGSAHLDPYFRGHTQLFRSNCLDGFQDAAGTIKTTHNIPKMFQDSVVAPFKTGRQYDVDLKNFTCTCGQQK
jgi:hypothetical protein